MSNFNSKFVSLYRIIESVYREYSYDDIPFDDAVEWCATALRLIGVPMSYINKTEYITIEDYRGDLPCDIVEVDMMRDCSTKDSIAPSTDRFILNYSCENENDNYAKKVKLNDSTIFASFQDGCIELSYRAFKTDENGFPMIPDNEKFIQAIKSFIAERVAFRQYRKGEISRTMWRDIEQDRLFYMGAAKTQGQLFDKNGGEIIKNIILRSIPHVNEFANQFKSLGNQEHRYNH